MNFGTGGIKSKIESAEFVAALGVPTIIANGKTFKVIDRIFAGEKIGTLIKPVKEEETFPKAYHKWLVEEIIPILALVAL